MILAINCGSSSLKYAVFDGERAVARGALDRIGVGGVADHAAAVHAVLDVLPATPRAIGHRLVHGGARLEPTLIDAPLLAELAAVVPLAPLHLPAELRAIDAVRARYGDLPQVACFDTAFHRTLPELARRLPLPKALHDAGVRRYGFHGLSYEYLADALSPAQQRRAIFAHLGNGASMVAVRDGCAIDTTMAFTPAGGLVMGTRPGDLDPGIAVYLLDHLGFDARSLDHLINEEAGLIALSETTSDMRQLLELRGTDARAALAVDMFCYRARMWIGALAAALGGLDTLVFTGGIGEHAPAVRAQICDGLAHLAIGETLTMATDEERMISRHTRRVIGQRDDELR
jgi:acetate kinase